MKTITTTSALVASLFWLVLPASAQSNSSASAKASAPVNLEKLEDTPEPELKIAPAKSNETKIRQRGVNGKVEEVEVTSGKSTYRLKADPELGGAQRGTLQGSNNRPARWTVFEFNNKKSTKDVEAKTKLPPALPPPTVAPAKVVAPVAAPESKAAPASASAEAASSK